MDQKKILFSQFSRDELKEMFSQVVKEELDHHSRKEPEIKTELISRKETAKILGISLTTLNDFTKRGLIPCHRISTRVRYKKDEVFDSLVSVNSFKYKKG